MLCSKECDTCPQREEEEEAEEDFDEDHLGVDLTEKINWMLAVESEAFKANFKTNASAISSVNQTRHMSIGKWLVC